MKKNIKEIDGDKVIIIEGENIDTDDEMENEYDLSQYEMKKNPYAEHLRKQKKLTVILDTDISGYFNNSREVNNFIRSQIKAKQVIA